MEDFEKLIVDLKEGLERELAGLRQDVQQGVVQLNGRFDTQAARLERHAALEAKDREIEELRERLQRLERRSA